MYGVKITRLTWKRKEMSLDYLSCFFLYFSVSFSNSSWIDFNCSLYDFWNNTKLIFITITWNIHLALTPMHMQLNMYLLKWDLTIQYTQFPTSDDWSCSLSIFFSSFSISKLNLRSKWKKKAGISEFTVHRSLYECCIQADHPWCAVRWLTTVNYSNVVRSINEMCFPTQYFHNLAKILL